MLPSDEELKIVSEFISNELLVIDNKSKREKTIEKMMINYILFRLSRYQIIFLIRELERLVENNEESLLLERYNFNLKQSKLLIEHLKMKIFLKNFSQIAMKSYTCIQDMNNYDEFINAYLNIYDFGNKKNEMKEVIVSKFLHFILSKLHPKFKESDNYMTKYSNQEIISKFHYDELTNYKILDRFVSYGICKIPNLQKTDNIEYYDKLDYFMNQYISKKYENINSMNELINSDLYIDFYDSETEKNEKKIIGQIELFIPTFEDFICVDEEYNKKIINFIRYASIEI
jgi:hypothetical protein